MVSLLSLFFFASYLIGIIIIKRISRAPIYLTRSEHRALFHNTDKTHTHTRTHACTHARTHAPTHTHTRARARILLSYL